MIIARVIHPLDDHRPPYYIMRMAKPGSPISIRLDKRRQPLVEAYAADEGITIGVAILKIMDRGLECMTRPDPHAIMAEAQAKAAHLALPPKRSRWSVTR